MPKDPELEEMRRLGYLAVDRTVAHLADLDSQRVVTPPDPHALSELLAEPLPRKGLGLEDSMQRFFETILPRATFVNHPRFFAYIPGPGSFVGAIGEWIAAATNLFTGSWLGGASMAQLEVQTLDWLREAIGLPETYGGNITCGGSIANLQALAAARSRVKIMDKARVYMSEEAHYSMDKAARILGFPPENIVQIPVDAEQRMRTDKLSEQIRLDSAAGLKPLFLCATAGTTSTGAIDPLDACAQICEEHDLWYHIDGAYGAALAILPEEKELSSQLACADSITLDPHKWLYSPFECGCLLTRRPEALREAFSGMGHYMQDIPKNEINFFLLGPELTRGNRALKLWILLRSVGIDAIAEAMREDRRRCILAHDLLAKDSRIEIVTPPQLSVFSFRLNEGEAKGKQLFDKIMADGHLMLSSSRVQGEFVLRFCVVNHRTTDDDINSSVAKIRELL